MRGLLERGSGASRGVFYPGDDAGPHGGVGGPGKGQPRQPLHDKAGDRVRWARAGLHCRFKGRREREGAALRQACPRGAS